MHSIVYGRESASLLSSRVPFPGSDRGQRPYDRDLVPTSLRFTEEHRSRYARESVETIPFTINLNLSLAMQLPGGLETASAETTAPLFPVL